MKGGGREEKKVLNFKQICSVEKQKKKHQINKGMVPTILFVIRYFIISDLVILSFHCINLYSYL